MSTFDDHPRPLRRRRRSSYSLVASTPRLSRPAAPAPHTDGALPPAEAGTRRGRSGHATAATRPARSLLPPGRGRPLLTIAAALVLSALLGATAFFLPVIRTGLADTGQAIDVAPAGGSGAGTAGGAFTVLLMGSDNDAKFTADHLLTQSMILVRVDPPTRRVTMMSIPRDLFVPIHGRAGKAKIDTAYANGGAATAVATVQEAFHVRVDHYVWIGLRGLVSLIDQLGGVDVVTTNPVLDDFYPADLAGGDPYAYSRVAVLPGAQHLDGLHAMEYVRSRHGDAREDFGRSDRQQQVLLALRAKARTLSVFDLPQITGALNGELATDMSVRQVGDLLPLAGGLDLKNVQRVLLLPPYTSGARVGGQSVVVPDWSRIQPLVAASFP